ncbi:MAG: RNA pseudouridine synthase, partial [Pseudomonadota bacterium]
MLNKPHAYSPPPAETLRTIHLDKSLIVVDKPSGLLSVPGRGPEKAVCAVSILTERYGEIFTVHRLDMDTSGVMVFARTKEAQRFLSMTFEQRKTEKLYESLVEGSLTPDHGTIDAAIARYSLNRPLRHLAADGQEAITHWNVIGRSERSTRVCLSPETGRSHQLRLHLASIGHA